ncbi:MAG: hypothetical protein MZV63_28840 [Marinilabiliales bacterium]|nr:hypothetical protein [Marinilabiliales bacterium]
MMGLPQRGEPPRAAARSSGRGRRSVGLIPVRAPLESDRTVRAALRLAGSPVRR